ncbi:hypothetical protein [Plastoroseomonas hellenica]|uniref:hypothetical protein n=1 Tax=Plastoroseomonas hellenica TaxID=2687306 RepID=UPI001BA9A601|nr:hypothetical protein [Plastoroseomonas hellenica]MBR0647126.1 hypothetical protein [Plastoroseomonas hellenica]
MVTMTLVPDSEQLRTPAEQATSLFGELKRGRTPSRSDGQVSKSYTRGANNQEAVFVRNVDLKVAYATFAMHLSKEIKSKYFERLDQILDVEEWEIEDALPKLSSFQDFARTLIFYQFKWLPELTVSSSGVVAACWYTKNDRITVEFTGNRSCRWALSFRENEELELATGSCQIVNLESRLRPYPLHEKIFDGEAAEYS